MEKGLEIRTPVGEAAVVSVTAGTLGLSAPIAAQAGDAVYLGDAATSAPADGDAARALAGASGYTFARTLVDPAGDRGAPHYRAIDTASDNRLAPQVENTTTHRFSIPAGCTSATISAALLYRPLPLGLARLRGWSAKDYVVATSSATVPLP